MSSLLKILVIFAGMVGLNRAGLALGVSLLLAALVTGFWFGLAPGQIFSAAAGSLISPETLTIMVIVVSILTLNSLMDKQGQMSRIVSAFSGLVHNRRISLMALPSIIGMLPLPGGALFSAPLVARTSNKTTISPEEQTALNYWFRHIWEYWWPLYPGVALALALSKVSASQFFAVMVPFTVISVLSGYFFLIKPIPLEATAEPMSVKPMAFIKEIFPILIVVISMLILMPLASWFYKKELISLDARNSLPVILSMVAGLLYFTIAYKVKISQLFKPFKTWPFWSLILVVVGIMAFKGVLESNGALGLILVELKEKHIPVIAVIMFMPFLAGIILGILVGLVGISFPIVLPLIQNFYPDHFMAYLVLSFTFGYVGMMLSPVHLCLVATNDYFKSDLIKVYRRMLGPVIVITVFGVIWFLILRAF